MNQKFSVLLSLYIKENPEHLKASLDSVINQTAKPSEIVIVLDGPITDELRKVVDDYSNKYPDLFNVVPLETNQGLGAALKEGMTHCRYELVARMDTDDIAREDRFELQLKEFDNDPKLDICGSHILEFEDDINNIVAKRVVPLNDAEIKSYQKRRDAFNHMTVMFKKSTVLNAGNYESCLLMEDTLLWAKMFKYGATAKNIDDYLVYVRIGHDMYERRGGFSYFRKYKAGRKRVYKTGYISWWDYFYPLSIQFVVALMPNRLRGFIYKKFLHKKD